MSSTWKGDQTQVLGDGSITVPFVLFPVALFQPWLDAAGIRIDSVVGMSTGPLSTRENRGPTGGGDGVDPSPPTAARCRRSSPRRLQ